MTRSTSANWLTLFLIGLWGLGSASGQDTTYPAGDLPDWIQEYGYERGQGRDAATNEQAVGRDADSPGVSATISDQAQASAFAQPPQSPAANQGLFCRPNFLGDWGGRRTALRENGIVYRGRLTQFFFGVGGGVNPPVPPQFAALGIAGGDTFEYTGNSRHDFLVSLDKFGGLPHSKFIVTTENVWGRFGNVSLETGAFSAPVFNAMMPIDMDASGSLFLTNFMFVQPLSEQFILSIGKTRTIGIADNNIFAGGDGSDQFLNQTFIGSPLMFPNIPFSTFVVAAVMPQTWGNISLSVMDGVDRSTEFMDFGSLFENGATIFGQVKVNTNFYGMPGEHHLGGFYKNVDQIDLAFATLPPQYPYPPAPPGTP
ncbi:MAG: hypothetical protein KF851_06515 [Pirellulaceae bacterium]|nr:hypothetical protein [Pirellulaceae bacterium]